MPRIRIPRPLAAIVFAAAVACTSMPLDVCACTLPPPHTILYGNVTDPSGQGVPGATVHMEVGPPGCQTAAAVQDAPTDATGRFRLGVFRTGEYAEQCIRLTAQAPAGSGLQSSEVAQLTLATPQRLPPDSVRRDLALRAP
ncbi:MAG TPA: carboxypeptidase-like regulatory domain-containing protein [Longimicrobium sp.]|nr:carboxypeptidase-like regulatory domain-containing protein [Longimicrobium sp.]